MFARSSVCTLSAAAVAAALAVSACGSQPVPVRTGQIEVGAADEPPAQIATVDPGLVRGLAPTTYTDNSRGITAAVPVVATSRQMTTALEVVRDRELREAAWAGATEVDIGYRVVASGPGALGIAVTPRWTANDGETSKPALVWYDAATKQVFSSPVLIEERQWDAFTAEIVRIAGQDETVQRQKVDAAHIRRALAADAAPQGDGPMLAFDSTGALIAEFPPGAVTTEKLALRLPAEVATAMLSNFGRRAAEASRSPSVFDGTPGRSPSSAPVAPAGPAATPSAATQSVSRRPSTAVGPDCRVLICMALTYDDGPGPETSKIVTALLDARAPATFFQLGQMVEAYPRHAKEVASAGNEVGNHSYSHPMLTRVGADRLSREINNTAHIMEETYGRRPMVMRPPYGAHNQAVDEVVRKSGEAVCIWNVDTMDWKTRSAARTEEAVVGGSRANAIVLMHDIHASTAAATPGILSGLQAQGVTVVTLSELSLNSGGYQAGETYCSGVANQARQEGCSF